jgi:hypothetical protein
LPSTGIGFEVKAAVPLKSASSGPKALKVMVPPALSVAPLRVAVSLIGLPTGFLSVYRM